MPYVNCGGGPGCEQHYDGLVWEDEPPEPESFPFGLIDEEPISITFGHVPTRTETPPQPSTPEECGCRQCQRYPREVERDRARYDRDLAAYRAAGYNDEHCLALLGGEFSPRRPMHNRTCVDCGEVFVRGVNDTDDGAWHACRPRCGECGSRFFPCCASNPYCSSCQDYSRCRNCGYIFWDDYEERYRTEGRYIENYSYKPMPIFHGDGPVYMGFELEMEGPYGQALPALDEITARLGDLAYLKSDGSIDHGFELVTHPMTYVWADENFPWDLLNSLYDWGYRPEDNCGLHIHVSREAFTDPAHTYRWLKLIYRNPDQVRSVARRHSDEWAAFTTSARRAAKEHCKGSTHGARYSAINVGNPDTFEMRVFASTLDQSELRASLGLVDASVEYTRGLTVPQIVNGGWQWPAFTSWVADRPQYADLSAVMHA